MEKEEIINLIKGRIEDEQRKHPLLDWSRIAAIKIYTEWFEYFNNENQELKEEMADKIKIIAKKVWEDIFNNETLFYNTFEDYYNDKLNKQD